jgi:general secretion pathway protein K
MSVRRSRHSWGGHDGFIVVAALWILSALAALASVYSIYVANVATSVTVNDDVIRAEALLSASLDLTAYRVTAAPREDKPTRGRFAFRMNGADVSVEFCSEAARVNLNKASKALILTTQSNMPTGSLVGARRRHPTRWTRKSRFIGPPV